MWLWWWCGDGGDGGGGGGRPLPLLNLVAPVRPYSIIISYY